MIENNYCKFVASLVAGSFLLSGAAYADPTVELQILNSTGVSGEIIVVAGEDVEVDGAGDLVMRGLFVLLTECTIEVIVGIENMPRQLARIARQRRNSCRPGGEIGVIAELEAIILQHRAAAGGVGDNGVKAVPL